MGKQNKIMDFFSALGRSLLMPIAALAACGIFLGLSSALMKAQVQAAAPFLAEGIIFFVISTINKVSGVVFTLVPVLFAISIAFMPILPLVWQRRKKRSRHLPAASATIPFLWLLPA